MRHLRVTLPGRLLATTPRAIDGPLTLVSQGLSRSLAVHRLPSSDRPEAQIGQIPKLIARIRSRLAARAAAADPVAAAVNRRGVNYRLQARLNPIGKHAEAADADPSVPMAAGCSAGGVLVNPAPPPATVPGCPDFH